MSSEEELKKLGQAAQFDQAAAGLITMAKMLAAFYTELLADGVPSDVAAMLVRDYFETLRERMSGG
jgi:hypothetical protein